jgi:hypothetical protein
MLQVQGTGRGDRAASDSLTAPRECADFLTHSGVSEEFMGSTAAAMPSARMSKFGVVADGIRKMKCTSFISVAALSAFLLTISAQNLCLSAQTKPEPTTTLNDQKTTLTLKFPSATPVTVVLDTAEVERLITTLAQTRAAMKPPRPVADPAPGTAVNVATVGRWWVQADGTGIDLAVSHPGYGWVGLYLDQPAIEQLNRRLSNSIHRRPVRVRHSERK